MNAICPQCGDELKKNKSEFFGGWYVHPCQKCYTRRRPTKHAPDAREYGAKIVKSKSKRSVKSRAGNAVR